MGWWVLGWADGCWVGWLVLGGRALLEIGGLMGVRWVAWLELRWRQTSSSRLEVWRQSSSNQAHPPNARQPTHLQLGPPAQHQPAHPTPISHPSTHQPTQCTRVGVRCQSSIHNVLKTPVSLEDEGLPRNLGNPKLQAPLLAAPTIKNLKG